MKRRSRNSRTGTACTTRLARRICFAVLVASVAAPADAQYTIDWFTVDGGGAMQTSGGPYTLAGTIGQADAGHMSGGSYALGGGFWMGGGTIAVDVEDSPEVLAGAAPLTFRVHPAAPNPLVHHSLVAFDLPVPRNVSARVYDVAGRLTRTLVEGPLPAGRHRHVWDGTNDSGGRVTAGVYFMVLEAGIDRGREKILVLR